MGKSLVLGFFDGVHKAHRAVIESALKQSDDVTLITFKESPALYFGGKAEYILSRTNSINKIKKLGVKDVVELDFSSIASMPANQYLEYLIDTYSPISISTGFNHTFGLNKQGTPEFLEQNQQKYNYKYICVSPVIENNEIVSSTLIRDYLIKGNIEKANSLLESNFILEGTVIHGAKIGRTIGFPTANISYPKEIVKIPFGVYSVNMEAGNNPSPLTPLPQGARGTVLGNFSQPSTLPQGAKKMNAIMNWGMKPTVHNTIEPVVEVHILDFDGDLYGADIKINVIKQIRGEKKFGSLDELKTQIKEDIKNA